MRLRYALFFASLVLAAAPARAQEPELFRPVPSAASRPSFPDGFYVENAASGATFDIPTALAFAPDGRMFVTEKRGRVYIVENGRKLPTPFINLEAEVLNHHDRGLLGIALDPGFAENGHVYLLYTVDHDGSGDYSRKDVFGRLTRYTASASNPNVADLSTRHILIGPTFREGIPACYFSHVPGTLHFGTDGTLLVGTGDGASYNEMDAGGLYPECFGPGRLDPQEDIGAYRALWLGSLAGKILRVDPATGLGLPSNPYFTGDPADNASRVWAYGLRNPFRFTVRADGSTDPADGNPGTVVLGDVGWNVWEELNVAEGGEGFGWPCFEGPNPNGSYQNGRPAHTGCGTIPAQTAPDLYWHHTSAWASKPAGRIGRSITGGDFYEGTKYPPAYQGAFFYADYPRGWMAVGRLDDSGTLTEQELFSNNTGPVVDLEYDPVTEHLYYVDIGAGAVQRLRHVGGDTNNPPVPLASADPTQGGAPLTVQLTGSDSYDPDGGALTFHWDFGDGATSEEPDPVHTFDAPGVYTVALTVADAFGVTASTSLTVTVAGTPPAAQIVAPADGAWGAAGDAIAFQATATDPDVPPETLAYRWQVVQVHNEHEHPDVFEATGPTATFVIPEHGIPGEVVYYLVRLTVTDSGGLSDTVEHRLYVTPRDSDLPAPWQHADIGDVAATGSASASGTTFTVEGGGDVWGDADALHLAFRPLGGDGALTARLTGLDGAHPWAKAGLMIRENLAPGSAHVMLVTTRDHGTYLQYRPAANAAISTVGSVAGAAPTWLRLQRVGDRITGYASADGEGWTEIGSITVPMNTGVQVGLMATATDYEGRYDTATATFTDVSVGAPTDVPPPTEDLPAPWASRDVGGVAVPGGATHAGGTFIVAGGGDVWGDADAFHFLHRPLSGDGTLTARLAALDGVHPWAKVGLMIRQDLSPGSAHAMLVATPGQGIHLMHREAAGGATIGAAGPNTAVPVWLRLVRTGDVVTGYVSPDGATWSLVASVPLPMAEDVQVGLMATSTDYEGRNDTAGGTFDSVIFSGEVPDPQEGALPAPWLSRDLGPVNAIGSAEYASGTFTVAGSGDIWGDADAFHFAYQALSGDATITARLTHLDAAYTWAKAGVMIRGGITQDAAHAMLIATPGRGVHVQYRAEAGGSTSGIAAPEGYGAAPVWLQVQRSGDILAAAVSADGVTWEPVASLTIPLPETIQVGLVATASDYEDRGDLATATFANVMVDGQAGAAPRPSPLASEEPEQAFALESVYPNPFQTTTTARLSLAQAGSYRVEVFDLLGRRVLLEELREEASGVHDVRLDLSAFGSGTYIVRVQDLAGGTTVMRRVMRMR